MRRIHPSGVGVLFNLPFQQAFFFNHIIVSLFNLFRQVMGFGNKIRHSMLMDLRFIRKLSISPDLAW